MKPRTQAIAAKGNTAAYSLIDYPGHGRLRLQVGDHIASAPCVIFVVDATDTSASTVQQAAEYLYMLFTMSSFVAARPKLMVVCNKSDLGGAATPLKWRRLLETEITQVNKTSQGVVDDGDATRVALSGGANFKFGEDVSFEAISVTTNAGIDTVQGFIAAAL